jgi:hypothetical protein
MRLCLALSIALSLVACKQDQDKPAEPAKPVVDPAPAPAPPAPTPTPAPTPAPAPPAAEFTGDVKAFIAGTVAGWNAATQELAVYAEIVGDEEYVAIRRYQVGGAGADVRGDVRLAKTDEAVVKAALAGLAAVSGTPVTARPATLDGGATVAFTAKKHQLTVTIDGKAETRKLDGGGVTTPTPKAAFALPGTTLVAVTVEYVGDVVRTQEVQLFGAAAAGGDAKVK